MRLLAPFLIYLDGFLITLPNGINKITAIIINSYIMEIISFVVLILLSLVGYSVGAVGKAGKSVQLKPQVIDLILISCIWAGAILSRIALDLNKWFVVLVWIMLSILIAIIAVWRRKLPEEKAPSKARSKATPQYPLKKLWQSWGSFSRRIGEFQNKIVMSLFFFIVISPFALAVKIFSDPLRIRYRGTESHWLPKIETENSLEQFKRQF